MRCFKLVFVSLVGIFSLLFSFTPQAMALEGKSTSVKSDLDFAEVRQKAEDYIKDKKMVLFAEFDHAKNAVEADLEMKPMTVLVFGSPVLNTEFIQAFPGAGAELPLRVLITEDEQGNVVFTYADLATVFAPYGVEEDEKLVQQMQNTLDTMAQEVTQ